MPDDAGIRRIIEAFRLQAHYCVRLGSPLTARLLTDAADDMEGAGTATALLRAWEGDPVNDALSLRFAGALHHLVLDGDAPALAAFYPSVGGTYTPDMLWKAACAVIEEKEDFLKEFLRAPPQTNETGRSAMLFGGFLSVARQTGMPLALREIGASGGLNLLWDRYAYRSEAFSWGTQEAERLVIPVDWEGALPPLDARVHIHDRLGCDIAPIDLADAHQCRRLESYVWGDQTARLARLRGACRVAQDYIAAHAPLVERAGAADFLARELAQRQEGIACVVYHSVVWQYMSEADQKSVLETIEAAGAAATTDTPLAWLSMEPHEDDVAHKAGFPLRLRVWPGGAETLLARCHPHGAAIAWEGARARVGGGAGARVGEGE